MIDVLILTKDEDGTVDAMELSDLDELGPLEAIEAAARRAAGRGGCRSTSPLRWTRAASPAC